MARIKIQDLEHTEELSQRQLKGIFGGTLRARTAKIRFGGALTQIDPPALQLEAGPTDQSIDDLDEDLFGTVCIC
jgi:hypothetical protein